MKPSTGKCANAGFAWFIALIFLALTTPTFAHADAEADRLFNEALTDMKSGEFGNACPKLAQSLALEAKSGTEISLAFCLEKIGKKGAAWHHYREAARRARAENRPDYVEKATRLASELEPKLAPLRLTFALTPGLVAKIDDIPLDPARTEIFVDAGVHAITASAEGYKPFARTIDVPLSGSSVELPRLEPERLVVPTPARPPPPTPQAPLPSEPLRLQGLLAPGAVLTAVGGASLVVSLVLGGLVLDDKSTVESECDLSARKCSQLGLDAAAAGDAKAIAASVLFPVGIAAGGLGVTFMFLSAASSPSGPPPSVATLRLKTSGTNIVLMGTF